MKSDDLQYLWAELESELYIRELVRIQKYGGQIFFAIFGQLFFKVDCNVFR